jgi:acyl-CoA synthetase (AMP-forming)/AMP-acid ligase II
VVWQTLRPMCKCRVMTDAERTPSTIPAMLHQVVDGHPDATALVEVTESGAVTLTYRELGDRVAALQAELSGRGVGRGDVVALWLPNWIESVVWQFAVTACGAAVLGVNTRYNVQELSHLIDRARPRVVVLPHAFLGLDFTGRLRDALSVTRAQDDVPPTPQVAVARAPGTDLDRFDMGAGVLSASPSHGPQGDVDRGSGHGSRPDDMANLFSTSGSTSAPKLAAHDQAAVVTHSRNVARAADIGPGDAVLGVLPLSGVFGFTPFYAAMSAGATGVLMPTFSASLVLEAIPQHGITHIVGGDDLFGSLKDEWATRPTDLSPWRFGGIGDFNGRVAEIITWAQDSFGTRMVGVYGSSELFALTAFWDPAQPIADRAVGGGFPVSPDIEVRVADPDTGRVLDDGEPGELQFRGYNVMSGYHGSPEETAAAFTDDGWFTTNDLGHRTGVEEGFVYRCRQGDVLRLRGFLVNPAEIQEHLAAHDAVEVAKVVGAVLPTGHEAAIGFVTLHPGADCTEEDLVSWCKAGLAGFKVPRRIVVLDEFPTTAGTNGRKIRTAELRDRAAALAT